MSERVLILAGMALCLTAGPADPAFGPALRRAEQAARDAQADWVERRVAPPDCLLTLANLVWSLAEAARRSDAAAAVITFRHAREALRAYAVERLAG